MRDGGLFQLALGTDLRERPDRLPVHRALRPYRAQAHGVVDLGDRELVCLRDPGGLLSVAVGALLGLVRHPRTHHRPLCLRVCAKSLAQGRPHRLLLDRGLLHQAHLARHPGGYCAGGGRASDQTRRRQTSRQDGAGALGQAHGSAQSSGGGGHVCGRHRLRMVASWRCPGCRAVQQPRASAFLAALPDDGRQPRQRYVRRGRQHLLGLVRHRRGAQRRRPGGVQAPRGRDGACWSAAPLGRQDHRELQRWRLWMGPRGQTPYPSRGQGPRAAALL